MNDKLVRLDGIRPFQVRDLRLLINGEARSNRFHRIEVEHGLRLANLNQQKTQQILIQGFQANLSRLDDLSGAVDRLTDAVNNNSFEVGRLNDSVVEGFNQLHHDNTQLHRDNIGSQAILNDILSCLVDKEAFQRELGRRRQREIEHHRHLEARSDYSDALQLTRRALEERSADENKVAAMLDEAMILFENASHDEAFALQANFQLAYLWQVHKQNFKAAAAHYERSLGEPYSPHNVRALRHLAHAEYRQDQLERALERMVNVINHIQAIEALARDLAEAHATESWQRRTDLLEAALQMPNGLLRRCSSFNAIQELFLRGRKFTATEAFTGNYDHVRKNLAEITPDLQVFFDGAKYAARLGLNSSAKEYLENLHNRLATPNARRIMLAEAMACEDFENA